jgi:2'-5' RNA ligase
MAGIVIVAIPKEEEYVWRISSEKIPHLTMLYLGETMDAARLEHVVEFLEHVVESCTYPFMLDVDHRGTLGADDADVVFFSKSSSKRIAEVRNSLLQDPVIRAAYDSVEQFPEWQPHLTLGYPAAPAKPDPRDYPGIRWVEFDKLALWTGDFSGPEFPLPKRDDFLEVAMADHSAYILSHHGVKGMKWGVRKDKAVAAVRKEISERTGEQVVVRTKPGAGVRTVGGNKRPAHEDAVRARQAEQIAKRSTLDALSNQELQGLVTRMNLEAQYRNLANSETRQTAGEKYAEKLLGEIGETKMKKLGPVAPLIRSGVSDQLGLTNKAMQSGKVKNSDNKK